MGLSSALHSEALADSKASEGGRGDRPTATLDNLRGHGCARRDSRHVSPQTHSQPPSPTAPPDRTETSGRGPIGGRGGRDACFLLDPVLEHGPSPRLTHTVAPERNHPPASPIYFYCVFKAFYQNVF